MRRWAARTDQCTLHAASIATASNADLSARLAVLADVLNRGFHDASFTAFRADLLVRLTTLSGHGTPLCPCAFRTICSTPLLLPVPPLRA
jgi:hypothetical protein